MAKYPPLFIVTMIQMKINAAIFDMDGLLLDTERLCLKVFKQACETVGQPFYEEAYLSVIGRNAAGIEQVLRQTYGDNFDAVDTEWRINYQAIVHHEAIPLKDGVIELLDWLKEQGIPIAVATSTHKNLATIKLKLANIDHYFDTITCGCEVTNGKPDPEIYLLAAQRLNVDPATCLAFEDSNNGVRSATSANMITYQIPDLVEPSEEVLTLGHTILPSLSAALKNIITTYR